MLQTMLQRLSLRAGTGNVAGMTTRALLARKRITSASALVLAHLILGVCFAECARAEAEPQPEALDLVRACQKSQSCLDQVLMRIKTVADEKLVSGRTAHVEYQVFIRRDGMRLDVRSQFGNTWEDPNRTRAIRSFMVVEPPLCVWSSCPLSKPDPPMSGIATGDWAQLFAAKGLNRFHGGPLDGYFPPSGNRRIAEIMLESPTLHLLKDELIGGIPCKVVEARSPHGTYMMWLNREQGCLPQKVMYKVEPADLHEYWDPIPFSQLMMPGPDGKEHGGTEDSGVLEGISYQRIGDALVAISGRFTRADSYGDVRLSAVYSYTRSDIQLKPHFEGTDAFVADLPEGARITNMMERHSGVKYESRRKSGYCGNGQWWRCSDLQCGARDHNRSIGYVALRCPVCRRRNLHDRTSPGKAADSAFRRKCCLENISSCSCRHDHQRHRECTVPRNRAFAPGGSEV